MIANHTRKEVPKPIKVENIIFFHLSNFFIMWPGRRITPPVTKSVTIRINPMLVVI